MSVWHCPACGARIPVEARLRRLWLRPPRLVFTEASWADLHAHIWTHLEGAA